MKDMFGCLNGWEGENMYKVWDGGGNEIWKLKVVYKC